MGSKWPTRLDLRVRRWWRMQPEMKAAAARLLTARQLAGLNRSALDVLQGSPAAGKGYDPATHIAVPGNTARQRLIQSGRPQQGQ
jgi:hypothetical protein